MIILNILPWEAKNEIKLKITYIKLKKLYGVFIILACVYGVAALGAKWVIYGQYLKTMEQSSLQSKSLGDNYSQTIKEINAKIDSVSKIQNGFIPFSYLLNEIASAANEGIKLQNVSIGKKTDTVSLSGTASTRNDLLRFKTDLENMNRFDKIDFPISNLSQQNNINFNLSAKIISYDFKE